MGVNVNARRQVIQYGVLNWRLMDSPGRVLLYLGMVGRFHVMNPVFENSDLNGSLFYASL